MRFIISLPAIVLWLLAYHVGVQYGGMAIETIFWLSLIAGFGTGLLKMCDYITAQTATFSICTSVSACMAGIQSVFPGQRLDSALPFWWAVVSGIFVITGMMVFTFRDAHKKPSLSTTVKR